jgi:redox-sensitive bicupin YhaK (pirin superfamily)
MAQKKIEQVIAPQQLHFVGDGFRVQSFISDAGSVPMQRMNPFIVLDYNPTLHVPPSDQPKGVGVHPHKGFETVTIAYKGKVAHHDSSGNSGVIGEGDVQWMTAASGVLHKEYHEEQFSKTGGDFQMVQLWVNLPAKDKKSSPKYQDIRHDEINTFSLPNDSGEVEVIAGQYKELEGAASTFTPVHLQNVRMKKKGKADFSFPASYNTALLVVEGEVKVNNTRTIESDHFAVFENHGEDFSLEAKEDAVVLILSGRPIDEPIAAQGPFVMNTREEIMEAIRDFQSGKFGRLEE